MSVLRTVVLSAAVLAALFAMTRFAAAQEPSTGRDPAPPEFVQVFSTDFEDCWSGGLLAADFTGDGILDLVFTDQNFHKQPEGWSIGYLYVLKGSGDGLFTEIHKQAMGMAPKGMCAGDFDGDGDLDLAVCEFYSETLTILHNDGGGRLQPKYTYDTVPTEQRERGLMGGGGGVAYNPIACAGADFNRDGRADLVVLNNNNGRDTSKNVAVFYGWRDGLFYQKPLLHDPTNYFLSSVNVADFNGDGVWDLAIGNYGDNGQLSINLGKGDGTFEKGRLYIGASDMGFRQNKPMVLQTGDYDRDGALDIAAAGEKGGVFVFRNVIANGRPTATFEKGVKQETEVGIGNCVAMAQEDFNGDGFWDLAVTHQAPEAMSIISGRGDGSFTGNFTREVFGGYVGQSIVAGDFDGDGKPDLALLELNPRRQNHPKTRLTVLLGRGAGKRAAALARPDAPADPSFERELEIRTKEMELSSTQKALLRDVMLGERKALAALREKWRARDGDGYEKSAGYLGDKRKLDERVDVEIRKFLSEAQALKYRAPFAPVPGLGGVGGQDMQRNLRSMMRLMVPGQLAPIFDKMNLTDEQRAKTTKIEEELGTRRAEAIRGGFSGGGRNLEAFAALKDWFESELKQAVSSEQFRIYLSETGQADAEAAPPPPKQQGEDF